MPAYDCGDDECEECQRAFGPDRRKAIANYKKREAFYASLPQPKARKESAEPKSLIWGHNDAI